MYTRCLTLLTLLILIPFMDADLNQLHAWQINYNAISEDSDSLAQSWWTPERARFIALGLLLSLGASLIGVSVLRRRIRAQLETIQFYEEEVQSLKQQVNIAQHTKSYLFTSISNELKSPVDDVMNYTTLLESTLFEEAQLEYVNTIKSRGQALNTLADDLMDFSQIESGKFELAQEAFILQKCLQESVTLVLPRAVSKELELSYSIESGVPTAIISDPKRLKQILVNLLSNGIKFTERGSISIRVTGVQENTGLVLTFAIKDTGMGMHKDQLASITSSLTQSELHNDFGSLGFGLALNRQLVGLLKGNIWVESTQGTGSTFFFSIPVQEAQIESTHAPSTSTQTAPIALVDPNRITRKIAAKFFNRLGADIEGFNTIPSLISHLKTNTYTHLFIDINEVESPNLMQDLMDLEQAADNASIVVITENDTDENEAVLKGMGVSRVICKPLQLRDLEEILEGSSQPTQS